MSINILDIQRMSSEDGPGLRTTVFFKGCTLACAWCHNPESIAFEDETLWHRNRCMGCGECTSACDAGALVAGEDGISINRETCELCFSCSRVCPTGALEKKGRAYEADALAAELVKDRAYWGAGGGVTLSGGEALAQSGSVELLERLRGMGVHTCVDTCGFIPSQRFAEALALADVILFDLKIADAEMHKRFTGQDNAQVFENFRTLMKHAVKTPIGIWLRTPIIPGATDSEENIRALASIVNDALGAADAQRKADVPGALGAPDPAELIERWELSSFNKLCINKYESMGRVYEFAEAEIPTKEQMERLVSIAKEVSGVSDVRATGATRQTE